MKLFIWKYFSKMLIDILTIFKVLANAIVIEIFRPFRQSSLTEPYKYVPTLKYFLLWLLQVWNAIQSFPLFFYKVIANFSTSIKSLLTKSFSFSTLTKRFIHVWKLIDSLPADTCMYSHGIKGVIPVQCPFICRVCTLQNMPHTQWSQCVFKVLFEFLRIHSLRESWLTNLAQ